MLKELPESQAHGELADIYAQIRQHTALPYVSSLQRHLATRPGWLEWSWDAIGPLFSCGLAQATAWRVADELNVKPLPPLQASDLQRLNLTASDISAIREVADSFVRVSPTNLVFSGIVLRFLDRESPGGGTPVKPDGFVMPRAISSLPALVDSHTLPPHQQAVLQRFETRINHQPFIPGLYRMLAQWPEYLEHLALALVPLFSDRSTQLSCDWLAAAIDRTVPDLFTVVSTPERDRPVDFEQSRDSVREAIMRYRVTSPQMVVFGRLIRDMLP